MAVKTYTVKNDELSVSVNGEGWLLSVFKDI